MDLSLYLVTDSGLLAQSGGGEKRDLPGTVAAAIRGGVSIVQLREKTLDTRSFVLLAHGVKAVCKAAAVPFLVNDRLDIALAVDSDGVHIGQDDMPLKDARRLLGMDKIIGVTVETVEQALNAYRQGADYVGTSAIFETTTKVHPHGVPALGEEGVAKILVAIKAEEKRALSLGELGLRKRFECPVITIGGINSTNVAKLLAETSALASAIDVASLSPRLSGVAVVSAIISDHDPELAARALSTIVRPLVESHLPTPSISKIMPDKTTELLGKVLAAFDKVKADRPLVHNITNYVVMRVSADAILGAGGSPLMAHSPREMDDIVSFVHCLVINIGTLSDPWIAAMKMAATKANTRRIPIVLDPVGAGATPYRMETVLDLLRSYKVSILKGNQGEIGSLVKHCRSSTDLDTGSASSRGVDAAGDLADPVRVATTVALEFGATVCMSGAVDYISDGNVVVKCANGNDQLGLITGTGCITSAVIGCFAGVVGVDEGIVASVAGTLLIGIAAELAVRENRVRGPASFRTALFDSIYDIDRETLAKRAKFEVL
ncbi:Hydroxyethylthiazole kinase family-domain-containing protein [Zopfochytrium polystomum]|nr:Hydroxyethylthiazole kinase family-domain-containing protein [Zopfochytrium polystomum]